MTTVNGFINTEYWIMHKYTRGFRKELFAPFYNSLLLKCNDYIDKLLSSVIIKIALLRSIRVLVSCY